MESPNFLRELESLQGGDYVFNERRLEVLQQKRKKGIGILKKYLKGLWDAEVDNEVNIVW